jgi:heat shock protein HslJ
VAQFAEQEWPEARDMGRENLLISLSFILVALSSPSFALEDARPHGARPEDLEGREWLISSYLVNKAPTWPFRKIRKKVDPYIGFESGALKGSPGCGRFKGTYRRSGGQIAISAEWTDEKETPCGSDEKKNAEQILHALTSVRGIQAAPEYWHSDALLLADAKGSTQVTLSPMQPGRDLSELQDTFWQLAKLQGSEADLSGVVVEIAKGEITFSTVSYFASFPFRYELSGLEFFPGTHTVATRESESWRDRQLARVFESALHRMSSYNVSQGSLNLLGKDGQALMALNSRQPEVIEYRRWRIAKYRGDGSQRGDEEGLVDATELAHITFLHGRVEGSPGCGAWVGTYKVSGGHVTVQAGSVVAGACYPAEWKQGHFVEEAFKGELRIEEKNDHIFLRDMSGKARIFLVPY